MVVLELTVKVDAVIPFAFKVEIVIDDTVTVLPNIVEK
jgi:hypothetical protein